MVSLLISKAPGKLAKHFFLYDINKSSFIVVFFIAAFTVDDFCDF